MKYNRILLNSKNAIKEHIININEKSCYNCKYLHYNEYNCVKFGEKDLIDNKISYYSAIHCRNNKEKCGIKAVHHEIISVNEINNREYYRIFEKYKIIIVLISVSFGTILISNLK